MSEASQLLSAGEGEDTETMMSKIPDEINASLVSKSETMVCCLMSRSEELLKVRLDNKQFRHVMDSILQRKFVRGVMLPFPDFCLQSNHSTVEEDCDLIPFNGSQPFGQLY
ncbi:unnamed protein product [Orchesella dallaii]|uniref:Uncharacterized protein n=1 Tax=Orchesella dallaii TaxID=48710 RepID=A0ABP1PTZ8_9HEXA